MLGNNNLSSLLLYFDPSYCIHTMGALAASTLIILLIKLMKFSIKKPLFQRTKFLWRKLKNTLEYSKKFNMKSSIFLNCSLTSMCWSCPWTMAIKQNASSMASVAFFPWNSLGAWTWTKNCKHKVWLMYTW